MSASSPISGADSYLEWVQTHGFEVVVFDMDRTMSSSHCGSGLKKEEMHDFIANASGDFVTALEGLKTVNFKCAVATGSDPEEYNLPGHSRETHILGPDLATALITHHCPAALDMFGVMVGYDCRLHAVDSEMNRNGKRHHMRLIQQHYQVPFHKIVLFDGSACSLVNEDGWTGIQVNGMTGFKFLDIPPFVPLYRAIRGYCNDTMSLPVTDIDATAQLYHEIFSMEEVSRVEKQSLVMQRDGVQLGFAINGNDPYNTGASILVSNIYRARSELEHRGVEVTNWREEDRDKGQKVQVFFVRVSSGLCFCFEAPVS